MSALQTDSASYYVRRKTFDLVTRTKLPCLPRGGNWDSAAGICLYSGWDALCRKGARERPHSKSASASCLVMSDVSSTDSRMTSWRFTSQPAALRWTWCSQWLSSSGRQF